MPRPKKEGTYYSRNKEKCKKATLAYYHHNKDKANERAKQKRREKRPDLYTEVNGKLFYSNYIKDDKLPKIIPNAKDKILKYYGNKCACCNEHHSKLLTVEHKDNDGYKTRRKGIKGKFLYSYLIKQNYPEGIEILCFNCNIGKRNNKGVCPHQE